MMKTTQAVVVVGSSCAQLFSSPPQIACGFVHVLKKKDVQRTFSASYISCSTAIGS